MPRWRFYLRHWFWQGIDLLFPPQCAHCGRRGARLCETCAQAITPVEPPFCPRCGYGLPHTRDQCPACAAAAAMLPRDGWAFRRARAWAWYQGPIRSVIQALKYRRDLGLGEAVARWLLPWVRRLGWKPDCFIPMPLAPTRQRERGYNQVALVAQPLAEALDWPYCPQALTRADRPSQVGRGWRARWANVRGVFRARRDQVQHRVVVLMDDVMTTGATLHAASLALRQAGAAAVDALTIARVQQHVPRPTTSFFNPRKEASYVQRSALRDLYAR
ncbi:MAG: ComF family protein [Chloroflexi bacterium]|nr:ComF family protein [Chloroflexota bacterium]